MDLSNIKFLAVILAAVASFAFGAVYYTVLGKAWMDAVGLSEEQIKKDRTAIPFIISFLSLLVVAVVLSWNFGQQGGDGPTMGGSIGTAVLLWLGLIVTSIATNNAFQGAKAKLTVLDSIHWLGVVVIQGLVISVF